MLVVGGAGGFFEEEGLGVCSEVPGVSPRLPEPPLELGDASGAPLDPCVGVEAFLVAAEPLGEGSELLSQGFPEALGPGCYLPHPLFGVLVGQG